MEERVHSIDSDDFMDNNDDPLPLPPALKPPLGHHLSASETYVVHFPKDQIYRIPPPENALIAERYRKKPVVLKKPFYSRFLWVFISILILALVVGIAIGVFYALFSPKTPQFSIARVVVKNPQSSHKKQSHSQPKYEISLKAKNTNERMSVDYEGGGGVSLSFKQKKIAAAKFPTLSQGSGSLSTFKVVLGGTNGALPSEIKKSLKEKKSKGHISLALTMNVPMEMKIGIMKVWSRDMIVTCKFRVSTLAKGTRVLSQQCQSKT